MRELKEWPLSDGKTMTLDGVEHRFHVRECDNRIAVVLSQPGWAATQGHDYWYVAIEELRCTGIIEDCQRLTRWEHRKGSTHQGGVSYAEALRIAKEWYAREAANGVPEWAR